jgi:membrane associated rhomboid family serine protease
MVFQFYQCLINSIGLYYSVKYFERTWGSKELMKHFFIVTIGTNLITLVVFVIRYQFSGDEEELFRRISGIGGFLCSLSVAFKRVIPEHSITLFRKLSIRVKYVPSLIILGHFLAYMLGWILVSFYTHTIACIIGWVYMRYYKYQDSVRGDRSETFSFISFFPDSWG